MAETSLEEIETTLEEVSELETSDAIETLLTARRDLALLQDTDSIDDERRDALGHRIEQRIREVENRDSYSGGLGAAMNPDDEDAA